jgi:hypothetical protein
MIQDILDSLTRDFFARKGNQIEDASGELVQAAANANRPGYTPVSSTLWRQREEHCATIIQRFWRGNKGVALIKPTTSSTTTAQLMKSILIDTTLGVHATVLTK